MDEYNRIKMLKKVRSPALFLFHTDVLSQVSSLMSYINHRPTGRFLMYLLVACVVGTVSYAYCWTCCPCGTLSDIMLSNTSRLVHSSIYSLQIT